ncbi:phosphotransferase [Kribbella endophytica]
MSRTHQVEIADGVVTKTYVDWSRGEHLREWDVLRAVSAADPDLVPAPIRLHEPGPGSGPGPGSEPGPGSKQGSGPEPGSEPGPGSRAEPTPSRVRPVVVMSRLPGVSMGGCLSAEQLDGLQVALDALWSVSPADVEPIDFSGFVARVRGAISSWEGEGVIGEAHAAAAEWLAGPAADELVEPRDVVIGHGDPNLANYLWDGKRVRIIDFEDAGRSDLAIELANLVEHLASRGTDWSGFLGKYTVDAERLLNARRLFAAFWLTLIGPGGPSANRNPPGTAGLQAERLLGLLD